MPHKVSPPEQRFWTKVTFTDSCWEWKGSRWGGYGIFHVNATRAAHKVIAAHRWSYQFCVGDIRDGMEIDHLCRNRSCVKPDHLEAVPHSVNVQRGARGVLRKQSHCNRGHLYSPDNTIRDGRKRRCRLCRNAQRRARARLSRSESE